MASPLATALMTAEALPRSTIAPTNVAGIYDSAHQAAMERYKAQLASSNAKWGGLAGLAGTALGAVLGGPAGAAIGGALGGGASKMFQGVSYPTSAYQPGSDWASMQGGNPYPNPAADLWGVG